MKPSARQLILRKRKVSFDLILQLKRHESQKYTLSHGKQAIWEECISNVCPLLTTPDSHVFNVFKMIYLNGCWKTNKWGKSITVKYVIKSDIKWIVKYVNSDEFGLLMYAEIGVWVLIFIFYSFLNFNFLFRV